MLNLEGEVGMVGEGLLADLIVVNGDPSQDLEVLVDPENILHVILDGEVQEFDEDIRTQRFQHDRLPHEYSYETLTYDMVAGRDPKHAPSEVPWSASEREDLVSDVSRAEQQTAVEANGTYSDELSR